MTKHRLDYVDGLRGIAALAVVLQHVIERFIPPAGSPLHAVMAFFLTDWNNFGRVGVVAFFAISGFVVPFSFRQPNALRNFVIARFFRLYPAYWLSLGLAVTTFTLFGAHLPAKEILANATMLQLALHQKNVLEPYWTLFIELIFYALCFGLFAAGRMASAKTLAAVIAFILAASIASGSFAVLHGHHAPGAGYMLFLSIMFLGTLIRRARLEQDPQAKALLPWMLGLVVVAALPISLISYEGVTTRSEHMSAGLVGLYVGLALFLICVFWRTFESAVTLFLGKISYALYLFHPLAMTLTDHFLGAAGKPTVVSGVATIVGAIAMASIVHWALERPAIALGKVVAGRAASLKVAEAVA